MVHPTQKPVELIDEILAVSYSKGDFIVDPFMGSGTSAVAALNCGIDYIGFDIDADYKAFAEDRIADRG